LSIDDINYLLYLYNCDGFEKVIDTNNEKQTEGPLPYHSEVDEYGEYSSSKENVEIE